MTSIDMGQWFVYGFFPGIGFILGVLYFRMLSRSLRLFSRGAGTGRILPFFLGRYGLAGVGFWLIAQEGALPPLLALLGFLAARHLSFRREASR